MTLYQAELKKFFVVDSLNIIFFWLVYLVSATWNASILPFTEKYKQTKEIILKKVKSYATLDIFRMRCSVCRSGHSDMIQPSKEYTIEQKWN